jgi:hypothetical protein
LCKRGLVRPQIQFGRENNTEKSRCLAMFEFFFCEAAHCRLHFKPRAQLCCASCGAIEAHLGAIDESRLL